MCIPGLNVYAVYYLSAIRSQLTDAKTNLGVEEGLRAETIMRYETTGWIESENMTKDSLEVRRTIAHEEKRMRADKLVINPTDKKEDSAIKALLCLFYLGVGHASQAVLGKSLGAPAADLLGHLLSSSRHPGLAFWNTTLYRPVGHTHVRTLFFHQCPQNKNRRHPTTSNSRAVDVVGRLRRREGVVQSRVPVLGGRERLHALKQ